MSGKQKKYAVLNIKGGVGKSTIAVQIAHGLAIRKYKVLLIDMDGQNDASLFLGFTSEDFDKTLDDFFGFKEKIMLSECIVKARDNLDLLPLKHINRINAQLYKEPVTKVFLKNSLKDLEKIGYDYIIIDCGPQRSMINDAILYYVDGIILPVQVEVASVRAIGNIYEYLSELKLDASMISLVVPNMFDQRTGDGKENIDFIKEFFSDSKVLTEPIPRKVKITEAGKFGKTIYEYDKKSSEQFNQIVERLVNIDE